MSEEKVYMKTILNNAITCSLDINYLNHFDNFYNSYKNLNMDIELFVRFIDYTDKEKENVLKKYDVNHIFHNPMLSNKKTLFKTKNSFEIKNVYDIKNIKDMKKILYSPRSFYTCHSRFLTILELLKKGYNILSLDVDTIFLKPFDNIFNIEEDIATVIDVKNNDIFCNEGFLFFKNNDKVRNFIKKICTYIFTEENFTDWNADHYALHKFYDESIKIKMLDSKYKDKEHLDSSIMWSGDGYNKYKEKFTSNLA